MIDEIFQFSKIFLGLLKLSVRRRSGNAWPTSLNIAIYLNDKYAYDAPSANGYVGILWAIGGYMIELFKVGL